MKQQSADLHRNILLAGLALLVFLSFLAGIGSGPLFDVDEGAFSEATREMLASKNYLTTYLNGAPRFDKPILIYWLQLLSVRTFGITEFAFRLPSAIAATIWALATFLFVRRERGETEAILATALLALSLQVSIIAKAAIADALLNCCLAISMFAIFRFWRDKRRSHIYIAATAMALGMLDKGPVAVLIPLVPSFLFFMLEKELRSWFRAILNPTAIALFLIIVLPWYTLEYLDQGQAFIDGFIMKHNVGRFNGSMEGHSGSLFYYVPVILVGLLPFSTLLLAALGRLKNLLEDPLSRFGLIWAGFVLLLFTFSGTKLPHYMIYGYTPLFIIMGSQLARSRHPWLHAVIPALVLAICALAPQIIERLLPEIASPFIRAQLQGLLGLMEAGHFSIVMAAAACACLLLQALPVLTPALRCIVGGATLTMMANFVIMTDIAKVMQEPVREAALFARQAGLKIVMWEVYYPSFFVYSESLAERRAPKPGEVVLTSADNIGRLGATERLYEKYGIILAKLPAEQPASR